MIVWVHWMLVAFAMAPARFMNVVVQTSPLAIAIVMATWKTPVAFAMDRARFMNVDAQKFPQGTATAKGTQQTRWATVEDRVQPMSTQMESVTM